MREKGKSIRETGLGTIPKRNMMIQLINANSLSIPLADKSIHCVVTSPPYYGLRDYGIDDQLGLENSADEYVKNVVLWCREVWRVLRDDGTFWLNLGDSYTGSGCHPGGSEKQRENKGSTNSYIPSKGNGLKPKDLIGIPWRVAMALQAEGWYLRSDIIWNKPNPMPESVTDRPTKSHEYLFLLTKSQKYFYDAEAIKEPAIYPNNERKDNVDLKRFPTEKVNGIRDRTNSYYGTHNKRSVWTIATHPYKGSHFATFPPALVEPCIKAGTSEKGVCPVCGAPWERITERISTGERYSIGKSKSKNDAGLLTAFSGYTDGSTAPKFITINWQPTCNHSAEPIPAIVLDPFSGSGTTLQVARNLGRSGVGIDLSLKYIQEEAKSRLGIDLLENWGNGIKVADSDYIGTLFQEIYKND